MHAEGSLEVPDVWFFPTDEVDFYNVETGGDVISLEEAKPVPQATAQQFAFGTVYCAHGGTAGGGSGTFYLTCHQSVSLAAHDINFSSAAFSEVAV